MKKKEYFFQAKDIWRHNFFFYSKNIYLEHIFWGLSEIENDGGASTLFTESSLEKVNFLEIRHINGRFKEQKQFVPQIWASLKIRLDSFFFSFKGCLVQKTSTLLIFKLTN